MTFPAFVNLLNKKKSKAVGKRKVRALNRLPTVPTSIKNTTPKVCAIIAITCMAERIELTNVGTQTSKFMLEGSATNVIIAMCTINRS